jgi:hypothetical protein
MWEDRALKSVQERSYGSKKCGVMENKYGGIQFEHSQYSQAIIDKCKFGSFLLLFRFWPYGYRHHVILSANTDVWKKYAASLFRSET